jgi:hypothetical protein
MSREVFGPFVDKRPQRIKEGLFLGLREVASVLGFEIVCRLGGLISDPEKYGRGVTWVRRRSSGVVEKLLAIGVALFSALRETV